MTEQKIILTCVIIMLLVVVLAIVACMLVAEREKNKDLQLENTGLITRITRAQEELNLSNKTNQKLSSQLDNAKGILEKKKALLEIQDGLLKENKGL
jgi:hypothetical protein